MTEDPESSAEQDAWIELAETLREQLRKAIQWMPAMNPPEIASIISAAHEAMFFEQQARCFDGDVERMSKRAIYGD